MKRPTVLVLGDSDIQRLLSRHFDAEYTVLEAYDSPHAAEQHAGLSPHLVLLAVPASTDATVHIRRTRDVFPAPLIILSTDTSASARIDALRCGADDYVVRPFDCRELAARMEAILRRA